MKAADGEGMSLHRLDVAAYANDVVNWYADVPQPGATSIPGLRPQILTPPRDWFVTVGATVMLDVTVVGTPPLGFQWRFNRGDLPGRTANSVVMTAVQTNQDGAYDVVVTNLYGVTNSAAAVVSVAGPPRLSSFGMAGSGAMAVGVDGRQGHVYELAGSTDLVQWIPIETLTNATDGGLLSDPDAASYSQRFYRVWLMGP